MTFEVEFRNRAFLAGGTLRRDGIEFETNEVGYRKREDLRRK